MHGLGRLVLLSHRPRLAGPLAGRGGGQEGLAGGVLLIRRSKSCLSFPVVGFLSALITVATFSVQAVSHACLDAQVGTEVEWLVVVCRL